ncbi:MAG: hypothetical protein FWE47_03295 [Oscillospiraceae bacterium]|nr:hypothetical protein [Oscillospiraceae bacterium]
MNVMPSKNGRLIVSPTMPGYALRSVAAECRRYKNKICVNLLWLATCVFA